jgi:hypothetical protein
MPYHPTAAITLCALLVTLAGCGDSYLPVEPSLPARGEPTPPAITPEFPSISQPALIYNRVSSSFIPGSSRYVLYDDSKFSLQYVSPKWGFFEYLGTYSRANSAIAFEFEGWNVMGPWLADGIVAGDSLTVKYNDVMLLSDFEDGVYVR